MTKQEFDKAVAALIERGRAATNNDTTTRVFVAAAQVAKHRLNLPDDQPFHPTDADVIGVLTGLDRRQRRLLKKLAEELIGPESATTH